MTTNDDRFLPSGAVTRGDFLRTAGAASLGLAGLLTGEGRALARATSASSAKVEFLTVSQPNASWSQVLAAITKNYAKSHPGSAFVNDYVPQTTINQKIQLLGAQNALPILYNTPAIDLLSSLQKDGEVLDLEPTLHQLGVYTALTPAAVKILKLIYNNKLVALPFELNMEGFWYNKAIFKKHGLKAPTTWNELVQIAARLQSAGIQPFSASGTQGWPITRLIGNYLYRKYGPKAMDNIKNGHAKLTDSGYVQAAEAVAQLGNKGYFGKGVATIDYDPAVDLFLQGKAAIFYMGSWELRDFTNATRNKIGESNIGFFPFPNVTGGKGNTKQLAMNAGQPSSVNKKKYNAAFGQYLAYMSKNYADTALNLQGAVTGFKTFKQHKNLDRLTKLVIHQIAEVKQPVLWFEAAFNAKATTLSQQDVVPLVTGSMSASSFMSNVQSAL